MFVSSLFVFVFVVVFLYPGEKPGCLVFVKYLLIRVIFWYQIYSVPISLAYLFNVNSFI